MAVSNEELDKQTALSVRVSERFKRQIGMRAEQLGKDKSQYLRDLVEDDLEGTELPDLE